MKKLLSYLLVIAMMLSFIPAVQGAAQPEEQAQTLHVFDLEAFLKTLPDDTAKYDYLKFATALQGLANRQSPHIYYLFETNSFAAGYGVDMDAYWLDKLSAEQEYLSAYQKETVTDFWQLVALYKHTANGLVVWDEALPATSNVASTVAGADDLLPVRAESTLFRDLMQHGFSTADVKVNLVGKFTGKGTIADSQTPSTGSAKDDAYIWAKEQYLDKGKTSSMLMTYSPDAWCKPEQTGEGKRKDRDAQLLSAKLPAVMKAGSRVDVEVTAKNIGNEAWEEFSDGTGFRLGRVDNMNDFNWFSDDYANNNRALVDKTTGKVRTDQTYTFRFAIEAPATPGSCTFAARMVRDGVEWFGPEIRQTIQVVAADADVSEEELTPVSINLNSSGKYPDLMNTMLPNADYYIAQKAFFWDLSPDASIAPIDDREQPVGSDVATLRAILRAQAEQAGDNIFTVSGFVPWWMKYTSTSDPESTMGDVASEWTMVDIISEYHGQVDADAYGMTSVSNTSVFCKVPLADSLRQSNDKGASDTTVYDKDTKYVMFYMGDYDASSWTSGCLPLLWDDEARGKLPLAWPVCADLANCVPHVFNYLYKTATANDYFVTGDNGTGYLNPMRTEGDSVPDGMQPSLELWKNHNLAANKRFDLDITGFLIAGNAGQITPTVQQAYSEMTPYGVVYQGSVQAGKQIFNGTPFVAYADMGVQISKQQAEGVANSMIERLRSAGQFHVLRSVLTAPSSIEEIANYMQKNAPDLKIQFLDPYTFMRLFKESDGGTVTPARVSYDAAYGAGDWPQAGEIRVSASSADVASFGTNWNVSADDPLDVTYQIKWDERNLYIREKRTDSVRLPIKSESMDYLHCDASMLFLDLDGAKTGSAYLSGDYAVYFALDEDGKTVVFLRSGNSGAAATERKLTETEYQAAAAVGENGDYTVELTLPWALFQTIPFTPEAGQSVGMTVMAIDHDVLTDNGGRQIMWCGAGDDQFGWGAMRFAAAQPQPQTYTLTYTDGTGEERCFKDEVYHELLAGSAIPSFQGVISAPAGYEFDGWTWTLADGTQITQPDTVPQSDLTATARWKKNVTDPLPGIIGAITGKPQQSASIPAILNGDEHLAYMQGMPDGTVRPNGILSRAEAATMICNLLRDDVRRQYETAESRFADVPGGAWYSKAVATVAALGLVKGTSDTTFSPLKPVTRAELTAILVRMDGGRARRGTSFGDARLHWAAAEIARAEELGWVKGTAGTFRPDATITRAEAAAILNRVLNRNPQSSADLLAGMKQWPDNADTSAWYYLDLQEATNTHKFQRKGNGTEAWIA